MKPLLYVILLGLSLHFVGAQVKYKTIESLKLGDTRELKIQLPRGYSSNTDKKYPLVIVFDADFLFEPVSGNIDYLSYWEDMPESIIVGVNQVDKRFDDCMYSEQTSLPIDSGVDFFEFISKELVPFINKTYRTTNFRVAVGHGDTANYINYFLLKPKPLFQGYVVVSPEIAPNMINYLPERLNKLESKTFYYLAYTKNDRSSIRKMTETLNKDISAIDSDYLEYNFETFESATHYSSPLYGLPRALESMFKVYQPINKNEYKDVILELETSPVAYLVEKYQTIKDLFGVEKKILVNDFKAISAAIEKTGQFEYYEELSKMARDEYPKTLLGDYYLARFFEEGNEPKKAMRIYQAGYILNEIAGITKDLMLERADSIKEDFGY